MSEANDVAAALAEYFDPSEVRWKPQAVSGNRALAICYVDARCVMDRLDEVLGPDGWQDDYEVLDGGAVLCRLRVRIGSEWITKSDVGGESEQPDHGDRMKAGFSDALKRAAVKFGVGRYLYRLPHQWVDYDPQKKRFAREPQLPDWARPKTAPAPANGKAVASSADHIDDVQYSMLLGLMQAKGIAWPQVADYIGLSGHTDVKKISRQKYDAAVSYLQKLKARRNQLATVTEAQATELKELLTRAIREGRITWERFASYYGIQKITALPAEKFEAAREDLRAGLEAAPAP